MEGLEFRFTLQGGGFETFSGLFRAFGVEVWGFGGLSVG